MATRGPGIIFLIYRPEQEKGFIFRRPRSEGRWHSGPILTLIMPVVHIYENAEPFINRIVEMRLWSSPLFSRFILSWFSALASVQFVAAWYFDALCIVINRRRRFRLRKDGCTWGENCCRLWHSSERVDSLWNMKVLESISINE